MEKQEVSPHKWAKEIVAWANGAKIERKASTILNSKWSISASPIWDNDCWEFRVYDPLREVREAFDRGETIQGRLGNFSIWNDYNNNFTTVTGESIKDSNGWEWRVKPVNKLELGKDYIHNDGDWLVISRVGNHGNLGFTNLGGVFICDMFCTSPEMWREASKEEVKKFFERHLIKKYGEDWIDVKVKECLHFKDEPKVNTGGFKVCIVKTYEGWKVWNKSGCLFKGGEWAEVLEEIETGNWKICDNFGERVFRHNGSSTGNNLKWRKATKQEVLKAPNYDGTATHQDFPFEAGDKVIARLAERPKVLTLKESISNHKFKYKECADNSYIDAGTDTWCYATEQEISLTKEDKYVPFEEEDKEQIRGKWIKRKDGVLEMKITSFGTVTANTFLIEGWSPKHLLEKFTFLDGTPFGKIKQ